MEERVIDESLSQRRHLDLGCGQIPRNPYNRPELFGIDVRALPPQPGVDLYVANLSLEPIPFPDNYFASVSAFDYLEHVPRLLLTPDGADTIFPFVRLMSEIWRVLAPRGRFYALTPAYPPKPLPCRTRRTSIS
jgi:SAM-dependent methyltransferase